MTPLVVAALASVPFLVLFLTRPLVGRMAGRSMRRRPVELLLVVLGSMLATAILTGSLLVGDTVDRSIRGQAYDQLGPIDEVVGVTGLDEGPALWSALDGFASPEVDGTLPLVRAGAAVVGMGEDPLVQPTAQLLEADFGEAAALGDDPAATGISGATPGEGAAAITDDLAEEVRVEPGDTIEVFAYGESVELEVDRILPRTGVAGLWLQPGQRSYNVWVAPGTIAQLAAGSTAAEAEPPTAMVAVSNVGDVEGGVGRTDVVVEQLEAAVDDLPAAVRPAKETVLDAAESVGSSFSELYFTVGMFAVAAGILLLVNIFVMLSDERRHELGMMRAVGLRRAPMVGQFAAEGWLYALVSAAVGALVGIGVGWLIAWRSAQILSAGREVDSFHIGFTLDWGSVAAGFALGFLLSLVTIVLTSIRIARLNVIAAVRDLPEARTGRPRRRWGLAGLALAALGGVWTVVAVAGADPYGLLAGPTIAVVGTVPLAARRWPARAVTTVAASVVLVWGIAAVPVSSVIDAEVAIPLFLLQGLVVVGAAVALTILQQAAIGRALARLTGGSLAVRIGLAYPLARAFRTAMTLGMVALVVLTLTYMSTISHMFAGQADRVTEESSGGFDVVVQSNPSNPIPMDELAALPGAGDLAPMGYAAADFQAGSDEPVTWPVSAFDQRLVAAPPHLQDLGGYGSQQEAWQAVLDDPDLVIVDEFFLVTDVGPPSETIDVGDEVVMRDEVSGAERTVTVAALAPSDWLGNGVFYGEAGLEGLLGHPVAPSRALVASTAPDELAEEVRTTFAANGVEADTVRSRVDAALALNTAFFTLMQQYVGAGLVIGMAGIGVIMVRAVRERRREIGVLRSLGFPTGLVARTFVVEASFVAAEGVIIGMATALVASWGLVASGASWAEDLTFAVPLASLAIIAGLTLGAALLASLWPARSASRTKPAVALRLAD